ncbi:TonB-linked outer membrane protein, SusC/RagA family [Filimonas lacunae]|uniref:TonB-linked outer membrane protein, SusC/RagA family n=1 Tax=Filimonas lacunae TaxID=477680 RepID=A0A173MDH2_9BACT|nr:SusC/RagA family TonB-linked outer membrane protein [Filimonas lacunae]BAV05643.1 TonB-dependent receptor plug [Filimonas lacunae]SIT29079.1 TonB-linked outer membrane protein, SusC/RagA family [Filimonas lacunae]
MQQGNFTRRGGLMVVLLMVCTYWLPAQTTLLHFQHAAGKLSAVMEQFGKRFHVQLAYVSDELSAVQVQAGTVEAGSVEELLNKVLAPAHFVATGAGNNYVIKKAPAVKKAVVGTMTLHGKVMDNNEPVQGASVTIKQDGYKTVTVVVDEKGFFNKTVYQTDGTMEVAAVGYYPVKRTFGGNNDDVFVIELSKDVKEIDGVVVTALGIKRAERALGYAATVISNDQLTNSISTNWTDALSGKVAGLNLVRSNSGPSGSNKIILRGENNLTGDNEALIVVDGVIINQGSGRRSAITGETAYGTGSDNMPADYGSSLNDLNPEDIETVTVLKGPGAAALYGQRGANGALIITTKAGANKKRKLNVNINSNASVETPNRWPALQYEYGMGLDGQADYEYGKSANSTTSSAYGPKFDGQLFYQYDPLTQTKGTTPTPWVPYKNATRNFFATGSDIANTISIDGGSDKTSSRLSITHVDNKWILPNTGFKRNTVSFSVNSKVSDQFTVSSKLNYTNKWSDNLPGAGYGNQSIMYWYIFWQPNANPEWLKNYWAKGQEGLNIVYPYSSYPSNPYAVTYEFLNKSNRHSLTGNVQAAYAFTKEFSLQVRSSIDFAYEARAQQRPYDAGTKYPKGSYRTQNIFSMEESTDFLLKYNKKVNRDWDVTATVGGSTLRNNYNRDEVRADSLTYPGVYSLANSKGPLVTMPYKSKYAINSFYGLVSVGYKNLVFGDITARQDWNSVLATPERTANAGFFYPSVNLSFIASDVWHMPKWVNYAKLRFSASSVGSGSTTPYLTAYNYASAGSLYSGGLENPSVLANPDLKPLKTITYEAGTEVRMLNNRLSVDVAVYTGLTKDQILYRIIDRASGYTKKVINAGKVNNQGIEVTLNASPVVTKNFKWTTSMVFSANRNRIKELPDSSVVLQTGYVGGGQIVAKVGGSMGDLYGKGYQRAPDGQVVYDATTGFAALTEDVKYLGNTIPKWKMGFTNDFTYKQFRLHLLFDAQVGAVAHSLMHYKLAEQGKTPNTLPGRYSGIIGNGVILGTDGKYRKNDVLTMDIDEYYRSHYGADNAEGSTFSTDFIKFREASIYYTLNSKMLKKAGLQRVTVGVYGRNLFIWSPWPMFDPEFGTLNGTDIVQGFEVGQFPSTRSYGFNLSIGL